ncbi:MAG TPA: hypothetical protein VN130_06660 [Xanthobacteraceae bacterium]|nr:hypothetical protein [Xanthobacteraceae bacterium]
MKKIAFGFAAAVALGLASYAAPASALPAAPGIAAHSPSDVTTVQYRHRHRPHCTMKTIVKRGHHGHRVVKRVRVCR